MNVVIVESAAKAKTINKYLGSGYKVIASFGHVRDLPSKDGSVKPEEDFEMAWDVADPRSQKVLKEITDAVKSADKLILATDPDREGEAISWHILQVLEKRRALKKGVPVERVAFNAVTKQAILTALANPRQIDEPLVSAYLARRALDYLVGFTLSPVLWRKLPGARSAGRVQSVALRLVCDREAEIEAFRTDEYWSIEADLLTADKQDVRARLTAIDGTNLKKLDIKNEAQASAIKMAIEKGQFVVASVEKKATKRNPFAPFSTATLQMDASRKLGFSAKQTMQVAQRLYEGVDVGEGAPVGLITYMRTDGVQIVPEAVQSIRGEIAREFGKNYVAPFVREYKTKAKNAQEAHEAIRPTDVARHPKKIAKYLEKDQARLYELVWKRAVASQMASAELEQTTAQIEVNGRDGKLYDLRANGSVLQFDGFLKVYEEGRDERLKAQKGKDDTSEDDDSERRLPPLEKSQKLTDREIEANQHFTQPPPRFTEATLVKRMEELGIGRPSTYAATMATLQERDYVTIDKKRLVPQDKGRLVTSFLEAFFKRYVEYDFTADLEEKLDLISDDKLEWKDVLRDFWKDFTKAVDDIKELRVSEVLDALNELLGPHVFPAKEDGTEPRACPSCNEGQLSLKISSKFGAFIGCSRYPDCRFTRQLSQSSEDDANAGLDGKELGFDPDGGLPIRLHIGRFGPYLQLGSADAYEKGEKPKRSSIPKGIDAGDVDLEMALKLLNLPREVGLHPETGTMITAGLGRYGPFVLHDGKYANLESMEEVFSVGINRAVTVLAEKAAGGGGRFNRPKAKVLKELGEHPQEGGKIEVLEGRYGPYVSHNKVNATLPKGQEPTAVTVEQAIDLLAAKAKKSPAKKAAKKPAAKKAAAKKPAAKKAAAKKPAAKKTAKSKAEVGGGGDGS
ncbi:MAG: type I DNA topoisomerase [Alphaproteobacteria bacterium]|nr:type I DNA topoisomerase [Alphaproteobacteria bacterium]